MNPYAPVIPGRLVEPGVRITAFYYATHRGLPVTFGYLLELGRQAAGLARWYGLGKAMVWEGLPDGSAGFWVNAWTEDLWLEAANLLARESWQAAARVSPPYPAPPSPPQYAPRTRVVHCQREPYDVYIGRPGPWGNPYEQGRDGTREQVITAYEAYLRASPGLLARLPELRGKALGCWCAPLPCHGDVLARYADDDRRDPEHPHGYWAAGDYG